MKVSESALEDLSLNELIVKAIGTRSMTEYAKACDVSAMSVSRIKSGFCTPSKKMCMRLASDPYVKQQGLSASHFLKAAGYDGEYVGVECEEGEKKKRIQNIGAMIIGVISQLLLTKSKEFQVIQCDSDASASFSVRIGKNNASINWTIMPCLFWGTDNLDWHQNAFFYLLGRAVSFEPEDGKQYSLILTDESVFNAFERYTNPEMVRANVTVALFDFEGMFFLKEVHLGPGDNYVSLLK